MPEPAGELGLVGDKQVESNCRTDYEGEDEENEKSLRVTKSREERNRPSGERPQGGQAPDCKRQPEEPESDPQPQMSKPAPDGQSGQQGRREARVDRYEKRPVTVWIEPGSPIPSRLVQIEIHVPECPGREEFDETDRREGPLIGDPRR
jgi:hypothetical protein